MTEKEALKMALEALEEAADAIDSWGSYASGYFQVKHDLEGDISKAKSAITAIKEALAQPEQEQLMSDQINYGMSVTQGGKRIDPMSIYKEPEQEPVAWMYEVNNAHTCLDLFEPPDDAYDEGTLHPLYTTPPQRKPLTDEEINEFFQGMEPNNGFWLSFARAIEAAHGIKE